MKLANPPYTTSTYESNISSGSCVDCSCTLGVATLAAAVSSLLPAFGWGLGLSLLSPSLIKWTVTVFAVTVFGRYLWSEVAVDGLLCWGLFKE